MSTRSEMNAVLARPNIAVLGAGPLGTLVAAQLQRGAAEVTLVKRRVAQPYEHFKLASQLFGATFAASLRCSDVLPVEVDVVIVAVRAEQLDSDLLATLRASNAKAVLVFSPLFGATLQAWREALPGLCVGMPALAAEFSNQARTELRYWQVPFTFIERGPAPAQLQAVVYALRKGGAWISWVSDAEARTLANTVALFPLHVAVFRQPHLRDWIADVQLRRELAKALARALRLGRLLGPLELALVVLVWWLSSATRIALAVRLANLLTPSMCGFVERHFGAKLGLQHAALAHEIQGMAEARGVANPLSSEWMAALPEVAP